MDEEKQSAGSEDLEKPPLDTSSENEAAESQDSQTAEESASEGDLAMPDMDNPKAKTDDADSQATEEEAALTEAAPGDDPDSQEASGDQADGDTDSESAGEDDTEAAMQKMMEEASGETTDESDESPDLLVDSGEPPLVERPAFEPLRDEGPSEAKNLDMLYDVTLPIAIELGRASMAIEDILNLGPGSVVELDKLAGEPVDLLVNNKLLAKGEVVVIDENFGVRITSMISPQDRIRNLK
jgi:flagellar motor switch protein FliN/FliY